jgi:hypothetical protein
MMGNQGVTDKGKQKRWEVLNFMGKLSKILFGMMDEADVRYCKEQIKLFEQNTEDTLSEILGFQTLSIVLVIKKHSKNSKNSKNTTFRKLDLFPSSGEGKPTLLGPLERASLSHRSGEWIESENLISLKVIHHRQNPIVTTEDTTTLMKWHLYVVKTSLRTIRCRI